MDSRRVVKYELDTVDEQTIEMSAEGDLLSIQEQQGKLVLWVLAWDDADIEERVFYVVQTGDTVPEVEGWSTLAYCATVQGKRDREWHVFTKMDFW
jgi:hypothetical protein